MIHSRKDLVCERNWPVLTLNLTTFCVFLALPVACRVSSKVSISGGSSNPKLYVIPTTMTTDIAEAAHTSHDHQLSGRHFGSYSSGCSLRAFSISPLLLLKHLFMTPESAKKKTIYLSIDQFSIIIP